MSDRIEYRGFFASFGEPVSVLFSMVKIIPLLTVDKENYGIPVEVEALWDTGAEVSCMKPALFERLKLYPLDVANHTELAGVGGSVMAKSTLVNLFITNNLEIEYCPVYVLDFPGDTDFLIGMDIIGMGDFAISNTNNKTSFSFVIPPFPDRINLAEKAETANKKK